MGLEEHVRQMKETLDALSDQRDERWGHDVCRISRRIHESVWECRPEPELVRDVLVPLLAEAMRAAVDAGRKAYLAGRIPRKLYATASSPLEGTIAAD